MGKSKNCVNVNGGDLKALRGEKRHDRAGGKGRMRLVQRRGGNAAVIGAVLFQKLAGAQGEKIIFS